MRYAQLYRANGTSQKNNELQMTAQFSNPVLRRLAIAVSATAVCFAVVSCGGGSGNGLPPAPISISKPGLYFVAGNTGGWGNVDALGTQARFNGPRGITADAFGNLYVADTFAVRKIDLAGAVTTLPEIADDPIATLVDAAGNLYVASNFSHAIFKVTPQGTTSLLAGTVGLSGLGSADDDGVGADARLSGPTSMTIDKAGNLYVTEGSWTQGGGKPYTATAGRIRKITSQGLVTTLAGSDAVTGSKDGLGAAAQFSAPGGIVIDDAGNLYVADTGNSTIRKITQAGQVTTIAGVAGNASAVDAIGTAARFNQPRGMALDPAGNLFVVDTGNHVVRKISLDGSVTTIAGKAGVAGNTDGSGFSARFNSPHGMTIDALGNLFVSETGSVTIRKITPSGEVSTVAGKAGGDGGADGPGESARFRRPLAVAADTAGNLYIADTGNHAIRKVDPAGNVTTLSGIADYLLCGYADGAASAARFCHPSGIAVDTEGALYVADEYNQVIRKLSTDGLASTFAGAKDGQFRLVDGGPADARFSSPSSLAIDAARNLYVTDGSTVRKITPEGVVTTLAGQALNYDASVDGTGPDAKLAGPNAIAVDTRGNLYVTERYGKAVRKITPAGVVTTLAGTPGSPRGIVDGVGADASFAELQGIAVDPAGNVYVSDANVIRRIKPAGEVSTIAGVPGRRGILPGDLPGSLSSPKGLSFIAPNRLAIAEENSVIILELPR